MLQRSRVGALGCAVVLLTTVVVSTIEPAGAGARGLGGRRPPGGLSRTGRLPEIDRGHLFVKFRSRPADLNARIARAGARIERTVGRTGWTVLATNHDAETVKARLQHDRAVAAVYPSYVRHATTVPNDPQWATNQSDYLLPLRMDRAWDISKGSGVVVADLDTGVALQHPDLAGRLVTGTNEVNSGASPLDDNGHGTMTTGIIAADMNNNRGVTGIAPLAKVMPVKVLDSNGSGTDAEIAAGISYVAGLPPVQRPKVINMSLGGPGGGDVLCSAVNEALAADIVVVASNGNSFSEDIGFPAACAGVVAVSATTHTGALAAFSSYGWRTDIAAPGLDITSTALGITPTADTYDTESGTSFSAPIVSGVAALIWAKNIAQNPSFNDANAVVNTLLSTARDIGPPGKDRAFGHGMVDPVAALGGPALAPAPVLANGLTDEPNDTIGTATPLALGSARAAAFMPETDEDWYKVTLAPGWYRAVVPAGTGAIDHDREAVIELYDGGNHLLASDDWSMFASGYVNDSALTFRIVSGGDYFLRVRNANGSTAPYTLTVSSVLTPSLFSNTPFAVLSQAQSVGIADLNGDGRNDIAFLMGDGSSLCDLLVVLYQTPARSFVIGEVIDLLTSASCGGVPGGGLLLADATGDGKADVLFPTTHGVALIPQGSGGLDLSNAEYIPGSATNATDLGVGDFNQDAHPDLVEAGFFGTKVMFGSGGMSFTPATTVSGTPTRAIAVGDVVGSANPEIVQVTGSGVASWNYAGGLSFSKHGPVGPTDLNSVAIDPATKSFAASQAAGHVLVYHDDGANVVLDRTLNVAAKPEPVAIADLDGKTSVFTMHDGTGMLGVVPLDGSAGEQLFAADNTGQTYDSYALAAGDLDSDGATDVLVGNVNGIATMMHRLDTLPANYGGRLVASTAPSPLTAGTVGDITLTLSNAAANANGTTVKLYDKLGNEVPASVTTASNTVTVHPTTPLTDGSYVLRADGLDDGGTPPRAANDFLLPFVAGAAPDETAPTVSITSALSGFRVTNHETLTFSTNDGTAALYCSKDNAPFNYAAPCTSPQSMTNLKPGKHTFSVFARDPAGNESAPKTVTWTYRPPPDGYWMLGRGGRIYQFGTAPALGNASTSTATDVDVSPSGYGYWIVDGSGRVFAFGDAKWYGNASGLLAGEVVTSISRTATGKGYWLFTSRGRVFNKGDAKFFGDLRAKQLAGPVLDSVATPNGQGYYMVASDGGVFAFGNAHFYGSKGGQRLAAPIRTLTPDPDGVGYWLVGTDGSVYPFQATLHGSMAGKKLAKPIVGMVAYGNAYLMVAADGGIFNFSTKPFKGSLGANPPAIPIVSVAAYG